MSIRLGQWEGTLVTDVTELVKDWEAPTLTQLGDLESLTAAGATGGEDGNLGFISF